MNETHKKEFLNKLRKQGVKISKKGNICLYDYVSKVVGVNDPKFFVNDFAKDKFIMINGVPYIQFEECFKIKSDLKNDGEIQKMDFVYKKLVSDALKFRGDLSLLQHDFDDLVMSLLDIPCVRKYLFGGPISFVESIADLRDSVINSVHHVNLTNDDYNELVASLVSKQLIQLKLCQRYRSWYDSCSKLRHFWSTYLYRRTDSTSSLRPINISSFELTIIEVLRKLSKSKEYNLFYFYKHCWHFCRNEKVLEYDFYCILIYKKRLIQFVIEFDGDAHYDVNHYFASYNGHMRDIMKQYYLQRMGVHLLRIPNKIITVDRNKMISSSHYQMLIIIKTFIYKICHKSVYIIDSKINMNNKLLSDDAVNNGLVYFSNFYLFAQTTIDNPHHFCLADKVRHTLRFSLGCQASRVRQKHRLNIKL